LLNLVQIGADALIRGGSVAVELAAEGGGERCRITGNGPVARLAEEAGAALSGTLAAERLDARLIQPHYARVLATELGASLTHALTPPGGITLEAVVPATR
jgi:histidine phosphotransferase ChpT